MLYGLLAPSLQFVISGNECWKREWRIQEKPEEEEAGPDGFNLCSRIRPSALNMKD